MKTKRVLLSTLLAVLLLAVAALCAGCSSDDSGDSSAADSSYGLSEGEHPGPPSEPAKADLSSPESAVRSYLDWVTYAYRTADSDVASHTMTPWEGVRVDSYIELNRQNEWRAIDQLLDLFELRSLQTEENTATLTAHEEWDYRYFSMQTGSYVSDLLHASYDSTYTVVRQPDGRWLVDRVAVTPLGEVE